MRLGRALVAVGIVGLLAIMWATCGHGSPSASSKRSTTPTPTGSPSGAIVMPPATLIWITGGLPTGMSSDLSGLSHVAHVATVVQGTAWLTRSTASGGAIVDNPARPYGIPIEVFAADPGAYARFLPPQIKKDFTKALKAGEAVLGQTSSTLRKVGVGGEFRFTATKIKVAMVVPDSVVGGSEMFVSRATAAGLGLTQDRFALLSLNRTMTDAALAAKIRQFVPAGQALVVKGPGESAFLRADGDGVPPVFLKTRFGEFDGHPDPAKPGTIVIDPTWLGTHTSTQSVPILGKVTCNTAFFPQLTGALTEVQTKGLASTVKSTAGCYAPTEKAGSTELSPHAWGVAIDINATQNITGSAPTQDRKMVKIFEKWGMRWGGHFPIPDGMHFEYFKPPPG